MSKARWPHGLGTILPTTFIHRAHEIHLPVEKNHLDRQPRLWEKQVKAAKTSLGLSVIKLGGARGKRNKIEKSKLKVRIVGKGRGSQDQYQRYHTESSLFVSRGADLYGLCYNNRTWNLQRTFIQKNIPFHWILTDKMLHSLGPCDTLWHQVYWISGEKWVEDGFTQQPGHTEDWVISWPIDLDKLKWECGTMLDGSKDLAVHLSKYQWPCGISQCIQWDLGVSVLYKNKTESDSPA